MSPAEKAAVHVAKTGVLWQRPTTLAQKLDLFAHFDTNWTEANDGATLDIAAQIRSQLMSEHGLTKAQCDALGRAL
jgi:hypothetical protein